MRRGGLKSQRGRCRRAPRGAALGPRSARPGGRGGAGTRRGGAARPAPTSGCTGSDVALTEKTRSEPKKGQVRLDAAAGAPAAGRRAGRAAGEESRAASRGWAGRAGRAPGRCFGQGALGAGASRLRSSHPGFNKAASLGRSEPDVRRLGPWAAPQVLLPWAPTKSRAQAFPRSCCSICRLPTALDLRFFLQTRRGLPVCSNFFFFKRH